MGQQKGKTGNPNGRPRGACNKMTADMRQFVQNLLQDNQRQIIKDLKKVRPDQRLAIYEKMLQYVVPKQQSIDVRTQIEAEYSELEKLLNKSSEDAITKIIEKIEQLRKLNTENGDESD